MTESIVSKVHKLLRLATSSNANEAALAAAKAQELIDKHQLSQAMLAIDEPAGGLDDEPIMDFSDSPLDSPRQLDRWRGALALTVARHNGCKVYSSGAHLHLVGRPSDAETVRYVYGWLSREVERLATAQGAGQGRTWRNNFRLGVVDTIAQKLREHHEAFANAARAEAPNPHALVRVNQALARVETRRASVEVWTKAHMKLRAGRAASGGRYDSGARAAGREAGRSITINGARAGLGSGARQLT